MWFPSLGTCSAYVAGGSINLGYTAADLNQKRGTQAVEEGAAEIRPRSPSRRAAYYGQVPQNRRQGPC
jgi:hypothetical protein